MSFVLCEYIFGNVGLINCCVHLLFFAVVSSKILLVTIVFLSQFFLNFIYFMLVVSL